MSNNKNELKIYSEELDTVEIKKYGFSDSDSRIIASRIQNPSFKSYNKKQKVKLAETLVSICDFLQIKDIPEPKHFVMLSDFLIINYPNNTLSDLNTAINLSITNRLPIENNHYQSFSPLYISRILNAYNVYIAPRLNKYHQALENAKVPVKNQSQIQQEIISHVKSQFEAYKRTFRFTEYGTTTYDYLNEKGYIQYFPEQLDQITNAARVKILSQLNNSKITQPRKRQEIDNEINRIVNEEITEQLQREIQHQLVILTFQKLINKSQSI